MWWSDREVMSPRPPARAARRRGRPRRSSSPNQARRRRTARTDTRVIRVLLALAIILSGIVSSPEPAAAASIQVTSPPSGGETVSTTGGGGGGGTDFATAVLGNAWDMADAADVPRVANIVNAAPGAGGWVGTSSTNDPAIFLLDPGAQPRPIDTAAYFQLSFRMYVSRATSANRGQIIWYPMPDGAVAVGATPFAVTQGWKDYTFDLRSIGATGGSWTGQMRGFRIDPTDEAGVEIRLANVRLSGSGAGGTVAGSYNVQWKTTDIPDDAVVDLFCDTDKESDNGTACEIAKDVKVKDGRAQWNIGSLSPGEYFVYARAGTDYAALKAGNAWDFDDRSDIKDTRDMRNESINNGNYRGITNGSDGQIILNVPSDKPINAERFKYIRVSIAVKPWEGQLIQVHWIDQNGGQHQHSWNAKGSGIQTYDYVIYEHGGWRGQVKELRIDPATNSGVEVELEKVTLTSSTQTSTSIYKSYSEGPLRVSDAPAAPAAAPAGQQPAAPSPAPAPGQSATRMEITEPYDGMGTVDGLLTVRWQAQLADPNQPGTVSLFYSTENTSGNGTKIADVPAQAGQYAWVPSAVPMGTYWILAKLANGPTSAQRYSPVPFRVLRADPAAAAPAPVAPAPAPAAPAPAAAAPAPAAAAPAPVAPTRATTGVPGPVSIVIEAPTPGQTRGLPLIVSGWAADRTAPGGPGVDQVQVYAFSTVGAPPKFLGAAQYGTPRPDLTATLGPQFTNSGFTLTTNDLPAGTYQIVVYARSSVSGSFTDSNPIPVIITAGAAAAPAAPAPAAAAPVPAAPAPAPAAAAPAPTAPQPAARTATSEPQVTVDTPRNGETVAQPFAVTGLAYHVGAPAGTGVDQVHVYAFPTSGASPFFIGSPPYGTPRPDAAAIGAQYVNSGFNQPVSGLPPGSYLIVVYAHSTITGGFSHSQPASITVR